MSYFPSSPTRSNSLPMNQNISVHGDSDLRTRRVHSRTPHMQPMQQTHSTPCSSLSSTTDPAKIKKIYRDAGLGHPQQHDGPLKSPCRRVAAYYPKAEHATFSTTAMIGLGFSEQAFADALTNGSSIIYPCDTISHLLPPNAHNTADETPSALGSTQGYPFLPPGLGHDNGELSMYPPGTLILPSLSFAPLDTFEYPPTPRPQSVSRFKSDSLQW